MSTCQDRTRKRVEFFFFKLKFFSKFIFKHHQNQYFNSWRHFLFEFQNDGIVQSSSVFQGRIFYVFVCPIRCRPCSFHGRKIPKIGGEFSNKIFLSFDFITRIKRRRFWKVDKNVPIGCAPPILSQLFWQAIWTDKRENWRGIDGEFLLIFVLNLWWFRTELEFFCKRTVWKVILMGIYKLTDL